MKSNILRKLIIAFTLTLALSLVVFYFYFIPALEGTLANLSPFEIQKILAPVHRAFLLAALTATGIAAIAIYFISRSTLRSLRQILLAAKKISAGNLSEKIFPQAGGELGLLAKSINEMAASLQHQFDLLTSEKNRLRTILDSMVEGVLVTNSRGVIQLTNPALRTMLGLGNDCLGKTILECTRNHEVHAGVSRALKRGQTEQNSLTIYKVVDKPLFLIMHTAPLYTNQKIAGSVSVFYDVTEIRQLENMRRDFVANVSHELKTPLTNIRGYAETLEQGGIKDEKLLERFIKKIRTNATQLQSLVEDVLELSAIESGREPLTMQIQYPLQVAKKVESNFALALQNKNLKFSSQIPIALKVTADPRAFEQILSNLIDNAIKYTPEGGSITVTTETSSDHCVIKIRDTGMGIPAEDLSRVFERFYRVDRARSRELGGTGLGLAIVKHLVQAQGGTVGVTSTVGSGSEFYFTLPLPTAL